jgi:hypothetical protein
MNKPRQIITSANIERNPQPLRITQATMLRGYAPAMPQSAAVLVIEVRSERIKRFDALHDLPSVRNCLTRLAHDSLAISWWLCRRALASRWRRGRWSPPARFRNLASR